MEKKNGDNLSASCKVLKFKTMMKYVVPNGMMHINAAKQNEIPIIVHIKRLSPCKDIEITEFI